MNCNKILVIFAKLVTSPFLVIGFTLVIFGIWIRALFGDKESQLKILSIKEQIKDD